MKNIKPFIKAMVELDEVLDTIKSVKDLEKNIAAGNKTLAEIAKKAELKQAEIDDLKDHIVKYNKHIDELEAQADGIIADARAKAKAEINEAKQAVKAMLGEAKDKVVAADQSVESKAKELADLEGQVKAEEAKLAKIKASIAKLASA